MCIRDREDPMLKFHRYYHPLTSRPYLSDSIYTEYQPCEALRPVSYTHLDVYKRQVIYGVIAEVSIGKLFLAGIIPGILFGGGLIASNEKICLFLLCTKNKNPP